MTIKSLLAAIFSALGIYFIFKVAALQLSPSYGAVNFDIEKAKNSLLLVKSIKFIGIVLASYFAIGFCNRMNPKFWNYVIYIFFVSIPIIALATFPDIEYMRFPKIVDIFNNFQRLSYYCFAAFIGVFFGIRFNKLKNI